MELAWHGRIRAIDGRIIKNTTLLSGSFGQEKADYRRDMWAVTPSDTLLVNPSLLWQC